MKRTVVLLIIIAMNQTAFADSYLSDDFTIPGYFNGKINETWFQSIPLCNVANQASTWNGSGFECISVSDDDSNYLTNSSQLNLSNIGIPKKGITTNMSNMDQAYNFLWSTGVIEGGAINISSYNDSGVLVNISNGIAMMRIPPGKQYGVPTGLYAVNFSESQVLISHLLNTYIYLDFNGINASIKTTTDFSAINGDAQVTLYHVFCEGTNETQIIDARAQNIDMGLKLRRFLYNTMPLAHTNGGNVVGNPSGLNISVTAGEYYYGLNPIEVEAFDTSLPIVPPNNSDQHHFEYYYKNTSDPSGTNWTDVDESQTIDTTKYNPGSGLTTMTNNRWKADYVYYEISTTQMVLGNETGGVPAHLAIVYSPNQYTSLAAASASSPPVDLPPALKTTGILIGRVIVQKGAGNISQTDSVYTAVFSPAAITSHNNLAGLQGGTTDEYYHLTGTEYLNYITNFISSVRTQISAGAGLVYDAITGIISMSPNSLAGGFTITIDGQGNVITTGEKDNVTAVYNATLTSIELTPDIEGSVNLSLMNGSSDITGGNYIIMTNSTSYYDSTLIGFNTTITKREKLRFRINSITNITRLSISVGMEKP